MAAVKEVEVLINGPSTLGTWNESERKRRRTVFRLLGQLFLIPLFLMALGFAGVPQAEFGVIVSGVVACCVFVGFAPAALGEQHDIVHWLATAAFGIIIATALRFAPLPANAGLILPALALALAWVWAVVAGRCFVEWCLVVPDRDITVRWKWRRIFAGRGDDCLQCLGVRQKVAFLWLLFGVAGVFAIEARPFLYPNQFLRPLEALAWAIGFPVVGGAFVSVVAGVTPREVLRVGWRIVVGFHTYDIPIPGKQRTPAANVYVFFSPFRDHRLRVLLSAVAVAAWSAAVVTALGWPSPPAADDIARNVWQPFLRGKESLGGHVITLCFGLVGAVLLAAAVLGSLFLAVAGLAGPFCAITYREFAAAAVNLAERSER